MREQLVHLARLGFDIAVDEGLLFGVQGYLTGAEKVRVIANGLDVRADGKRSIRGLNRIHGWGQDTGAKVTPLGHTRRRRRSGRGLNRA
jgi:hypothetical protein